MRATLVAFLLAFASGVWADDYLSAAQRHGIDPDLLRAVAIVESNGYPWTFNVDGEPLRFATKKDALDYYRYVRANPVMLRTVRKGVYRYRWYASAIDAEQDYLQARQEDAQLRLPRTHAAMLRVVQADNTDVGRMQINWRTHGHRVGVTFDRLLEPAVNMEYGARHLSELVRAYGLWEGVGRYHSPTPWRRTSYANKVYRTYQQLYERNLRQTRVSGPPAG